MVGTQTDRQTDRLWDRQKTVWCEITYPSPNFNSATNIIQIIDPYRKTSCHRMKMKQINTTIYLMVLIWLYTITFHRKHNHFVIHISSRRYTTTMYNDCPEHSSSNARWHAILWRLISRQNNANQSRISQFPGCSVFCSTNMLTVINLDNHICLNTCTWDFKIY